MPRAGLRFRKILNFYLLNTYFQNVYIHCPLPSYQLSRPKSFSLNIIFHIVGLEFQAGGGLCQPSQKFRGNRVE